MPNQRNRRGYGNVANNILRKRESPTGRGMLRSTWPRVSSISLLYSRPLGHAVMEAMQPRQLSVDAEVLVECSVTLCDFAHHPDASAGRVHLLPPECVGRAGGKAEAAVDALVHKGGFGRTNGVESAGPCCAPIWTILCGANPCSSVIDTKSPLRIFRG